MIREIKSLSKKHLKCEDCDILIKLFILPPSLFVSWAIIKFTNISANNITFSGLFFGCTGAIASIKYGINSIVLGFMLFYLCDFIDGVVASSRNGGTRFGAILDMVTDRVVLSITVLALVSFHLRTNDKYEILLVVFYYILFMLIDIRAFSILSADRGYNVINKTIKPNTLNNNFSFFTLKAWIPDRLSSYLYIILVYIISGDFTFAYTAGIIALCLSAVKKII